MLVWQHLEGKQETRVLVFRTVKLKEIRIRMVFRDNFLENRQEETELATYSGHTSSDTDGRNH